MLCIINSLSLSCEDIALSAVNWFVWSSVTLAVLFRVISKCEILKEVLCSLQLNPWSLIVKLISRYMGYGPHFNMK